MHGHSAKWDSKDIHERFGYRYTDAELTDWPPKVHTLARDAGQTHVLFNNCYRDYPRSTPSGSPNCSSPDRIGRPASPK
jgi:uncharacterized protein YecE (DUF72 family)